MWRRLCSTCAEVLNQICTALSSVSQGRRDAPRSSWLIHSLNANLLTWREGVELTKKFGPANWGGGGGRGGATLGWI